MPIELIILAWGCLLALVHIFAAVRAKTAQYGTAWNVGARDQSLPEPKPLVGRLARAQANYFETFPIVAIAILIDAQLGLFDRWTAIGAALWLGARIVYLPLYAAGVPVVRTMVFGISMIGVLMLLWPALRLAF
ncbi:putative MAPEG superfamily protein [Sphingobium sp. B2D3A]|uniref:MAPEG family protein n=1 Tax=Sphingobium TaxID=165695 RepID=UPI0015EBD9D5|nr:MULTISPECIES: MAPEG family protein [Sphingobium]MCW2336392.1 putative MAPEG superfamily protein [Sphingobium sp. B2D3A]MCW2363461.1 putative MAPEG superfamily protein [Sphingobium sp. B10D3B]MCW2386146.1 putative MAPEG superfamily protein [Sphingobium sp. B2D3D]MCW2392370.1 putative MAPEG superfamily protein [Sphingobium sp. B11D3A]MCW2403140.1 putative MAPEG superfamily protein [Sphingobium sp. B10D7B]